jgi:putative tricarboxylic transport membrane protein
MGTRPIGMTQVAGLISALVFASIGIAAAGWTPSKPVEFVVQAAPGGGSDIMARTIASIVEVEKLSPVPFVVVNKPGGGSVVGTTYVTQQRANPHVLATYHSGNLVAPITAGLEAAMVKNLTVIAVVGVDEQLLVVRADSPFKSIKEIVAEAKKRPGAITVAGTATGQDDQICNRLFERAAEIKLRYLPVNSGGEAMTALLGGHVDLIWANPSEFAPQLDAKQVRPLGVAREERLPYMANIPTFKEEGYSVTWKMFRGIVTPAGISQEAIGYYEALFKKMSETPRWKEGYIKKYMLTASWMGHQEAAKFVEGVEQTCIAILKELALKK